MGICDTEVYTDNNGDLKNESIVPKTSMILDGKGSTREGKTSPRLGHRRSSRIRKRDGTIPGCPDVSCSSSDESDPNIQMGPNDLIEDEEKLMIKGESNMDRSQRAEDQLLAVALMKSVIEKNAEIGTKSTVFKQEDNPDGNAGKGVKKNDEIKKELQDEKEVVQENQLDVKIANINQSMNASIGIDTDANASTNTINCSKLTQEYNKKNEINAVQSSGGMTNIGTNVQLGSALRTENVTSEKAITNVVKTKSSKLAVSNVKTATSRNSRIRTKMAKNGRTMALKGAYASIREAPRVVRQPSVSIPVPNPILSTPAPRDFKQTEDQALKPNLNLNVLKKEDVVHQPMTNCSQDKFASQTIPVPASCMSSNVLDEQPIQNEAATRTRTNSVSFAVSNHPGNPTNVTNNFPPRRRIFSIDLDPEGFDFDLSIGVTCNSPAADYVDSVSALPPIISSSSTADKKDLGSEFPNRDHMTHNDTALPQDSSVPQTRNRGLSFELFTFTQNECTTSYDPADLNEEALNGGRPRGDSIIFDPVSFSDGGIHEENALQRLRHNSMVLEETDEIELMNTPGFIEGPATQSLPRSHHGLSTSNPTINHARNKATQAIPNKIASSNTNGSGYHIARQSKSSSTNINTTKTKTHVTMSVISGNNVQNSENTIHMPQGSAAAAAAAASLSSQIIPCSLNGTITTCPMELLNKGGRIGIYLPDARRERIAKFHSKRKNRIWRKRIKYDCRKKLADSRPRIKGRFVKSLEE